MPQIIYVNHSSWWDGLIFLEILRRFDNENYVLMEEKQLRKLFFFRLPRSVFSRSGKTARGARKY
jgi:1-acyl-sn-glycerol-3-phosphate acyltransferase